MYILLIILAVLALILFIPVRVLVTANLSEQEIKLSYAFLKLKIYPKPKKTENKHEKSKETTPDKKDFNLKLILKLIKESKSVITSFLNDFVSYLIKNGIRVRELNISGKFGTGDPAYTGILCGGVYASVYNIIARLENGTGLKKHEVNLNPDFDTACFEFGMYTELVTRLWHFLVLMIIALKYGIKFMLIYKKVRKENNNG